MIGSSSQILTPLIMGGFNAVRSAIFPVLASRIRYYSTSREPLRYAPHRFTLEEAARKFFEIDANRLFGPSEDDHDGTTEKALVPNERPLKKAILPIWKGEASVKSTSFSAMYGVDRVETYINSKGKVQMRIHTDWYPISGVIGGCRYNEEDEIMCVYGGHYWSSRLVEQAMGGRHTFRLLKNFDPKSEDKNTVIDPFNKRSAIVQETVNKRIRSSEIDRVHQAIHKKVYCNHVRVTSVDTEFSSFNITPIYLSGYVLQYPGTAPRIMSAYDDLVKVSGNGPLSMVKCVSTAAVVGTLGAAVLPFIFPALGAFTRVARVGFVFSSMLATGSWVYYRDRVNYYFQQRTLDKEWKINLSVSETEADKWRREFIEGGSKPTQEMREGETFNINPKYFEILGLNPKLPVTEEMVKRAFHKKIITFHPDNAKTGSDEKARKLIFARDTMLQEIRNQRTFKQARRHYSTQRQIVVKEPPRSVYDPRAKELIHAVLEERNFEKALRLVEKEHVHPDVHDQGENTLLSEAAKRGDLEAIRMAIKLGCSPDTSCDCPVHMTPLHYAAAGGHVQAVELLIKNKASVNLINSLGQTPLDMAIKHNHEAVAKVLRAHGAQQHRTVEGLAGLWAKIRGGTIGYSSEDRTLLLGKGDDSESNSRPRIEGKH